MKLRKIEINNYRLLSKFSIDIEDDLSIIIGKNNTGKTSILNIIDKTISNNAKDFSFSIYDFNIDFQKDLFKQINTEKVTWVTNGINVCYYINYDDKDDIYLLTPFILDLDPNIKTIILQFAFTLNQDNFSKLKDDYLLWITKNKKENNFEDFEKFMNGKTKKYFKTYKKSIGYNIEKNEKSEEIFSNIENNDIANLINFKYISAKRDITNLENDSTLSILSSNYYNEFYNEKNIDDANQTVMQELDDTIEGASIKLSLTYSKIFKSITDNIKKFGGIKENESELKIISQLKKENLLKNNTTVKYKEKNHGFLPENYNGLGYLNLFNILFELEIRLASFRQEGKKDAIISAINLLYIEEPEAHTHPQMQYIFINNIIDVLKEGKNKERMEIHLQTIISTHSSHIVSGCDFNNIKYLLRENHNVISKNLKDLEGSYDIEKDEEKKKYKFLKQYITLNKSEIFFADKIIFIEGDTERILMPSIMKKLDLENDKKEELPLLSQNISILEVGAYSQLYSRLIEFLHIKTLIITDLDSIDENRKSIVVKPTAKTSNSSLKFYFNISDQTIDYLLNKIEEDKILELNKNIPQKSDKGYIRVAYQMKDNDYIARSFEDAFISINELFLNEYINKFSGLSNIEIFNDEIKKKNYYLIAKDCIFKKPNFALDIILNSNDCFSNWKIPKYIEEGLLWLKKN